MKKILLAATLLFSFCRLEAAEAPVSPGVVPVPTIGNRTNRTYRTDRNVIGKGTWGSATPVSGTAEVWQTALDTLADSVIQEPVTDVKLLKLMRFEMSDYEAEADRVSKAEQGKWERYFNDRLIHSGKWKFTKNGALAKGFLRGEFVGNLGKQIILKANMADAKGNKLWIDSAIVRDGKDYGTKGPRPAEVPAGREGGLPLKLGAGVGAGVNLLNGQVVPDLGASARLSVTQLIAARWHELSQVSIGPFTGKGTSLQFGAGFKHFIPQNATYYSGVGELNGPAASLCWSDWLTLELDTWSREGLAVNQVTGVSAWAFQSALTIPVRFGPHVLLYAGPGARFESVSVVATHVPVNSISYGNNAGLFSMGMKIKAWNIGLDANWAYDFAATHNQSSTLKIGGFYEWNL